MPLEEVRIMYGVFLVVFVVFSFALFRGALEMFQSSFQPKFPPSERIGRFVLGFIVINIYVLAALPMSVRYLGTIWDFIGYEPPQTFAQFVAALVGGAVASYTFLRKR